MRRILVILLALVGLGQLSHAEDENFFAEGKCWLINRDYLVSGSKLYKIYVDDEVEVDGVIARRLRREWVETGESELKYIGYEKDGVVYIYFERDDQSGFVPMIDFNAKVGDRLKKHLDEYPFDDLDWDEYYYETIEGEGTLFIDGRQRRIQYLHSSYDPSSAWIEGIGVAEDLYYILLTFTFPSCYCDANYSDYVVACYQGDECVYEASRLNEYLTGLSSLDDIAVDEESEPLYDLMGRRVAEAKAGQIYVTPSGKKFVKK